MKRIINLNFIGTNDDDELIIGSDDDDTYTVTKGMDKFNGGAGTDTIIIPSSDSMVIRGVDSSGDYTGIIGEKFLYIRLTENGSFLNEYTIAYGVEFIEFEDTGRGYNTVIYNSSNFFNLTTVNINNLTVENNLEEKINLKNHFYSFNEGYDITYQLDISEKSLQDQITIEDQEIIFTSGSSGPKVTSTITIIARETSVNTDLSDNNSASLIFEIQMTDDDYHPYFSSFKIENKASLEPFNNETNKGTLNYSESNDIIVITGGGETERGSYGDDIYIVSDLIPTNSNISIIDNFGSNKIQFPDNTLISKALFTQDAVRLTLSNSKVITINGSNNFSFNLGANVTSGDTSDNLNYVEFANIFEISDVLNLSGPLESTITDMYLL
tara:strand:- start:1642 stop:2790 length:1149 start_codon:yes stop_codon:yes gene_type:complete